MCSSHRLPDAVLRERRGFTLVELLVALTISGILTTVIFQVLQGNGRFVSMQSAREEVQQNSRAALDLIAADLRSTPPSGFLEISPNVVHLHVPRAWGMLCNDVGTGVANAWVLFPNGTVPPDFQYGRRQWGIAINQTADPMNLRTDDDAYRFIGNIQQASTADQCTGVQAQTAQVTAMGFRTTGVPLAESGLTIPAGTPVMIFEEVRYDVAESSGGGDYWVRRMTGYSGSTRNMQPMAGPVGGVNSLRFRYFAANGTTETTNPAEVRQIQINLATQSRSRRLRNGVLAPQQTDSASVDVFLRN